MKRKAFLGIDKPVCAAANALGSRIEVDLAR
jgi:hypothetical protein